LANQSGLSLANIIHFFYILFEFKRAPTITLTSFFNEIHVGHNNLCRIRD